MTATVREINSVVPLMALAYVRRSLGDAAVEEVIDRAGVAADEPTLAQDDEWTSLAMAAAIADAAGDLCRDADVGRRIGEQYFLNHQTNGVSNFLLAEGDIASALELAVTFASRMSGTRQYRIRDLSETGAIVEGRPGTARGPARFFCEMVSTYLGRIPTLFGAAGSAVHLSCIERGDDHCEYVLRWDAAAALVGEEAERSRGLADEAIASYEVLQAMSAELALLDEVPAVLERVVRRLNTAVMASRLLISVQPRDGERITTVGVGFAEDQAVDAAAALWAGEDGDHPGVVLSAPIQSAHRHYGYLAAYLPPDAGQISVDERLLLAYAGHASAAVERAVTIEDAQRSHQATAALLNLARSLAAAATVDDVCQQLAAAVPDVTGCEVGCVWLWHAPTGTFRLSGWTQGWTLPLQREIRVEELRSLADVAERPRHVVVDAHDEDPLLRRLFDEWGVEEAVATPILLRGDLLGFVAAAVTTPLPGDAARSWLLERLAALADHASTALDSTMLLEQIRQQALHDALTGLPNRVLAEDRCNEALAAAEASGGGVAMLFVDLDRFKNVNDTLGHSAGDELIRQVAGRLEACVGANGTVARLGGDEFLVLLPGSDAATGISTAEAVIREVRQRFEIAERALFISASVGIACYPDHGTEYPTLMSHADSAMYQAKAYGRSTYALHTDDLVSGRRGRLQLESELHLALERDELAVHYQPQIDLGTEAVVGVEALVRWSHPTRGLIGPEVFLALAEDSGVIVEIDAWVRRCALAQARAWADAGLPLRIALNLSTRDLRNPAIVDELRGTLDATGVRPDLVELEITDRIVMSDGDLPRVMDRLKTLGTRLAIDDFGTGNSVLSRLRHCPVDVLKIDRTFIRELGMDNPDGRLVHALISMAHALGLTVVGEGIETALQAEVLQHYGCDLGQGFLYSPAVPAGQVPALVQGRAARPAAIVG